MPVFLLSTWDRSEDARNRAVGILGGYGDQRYVPRILAVLEHNKEEGESPFAAYTALTRLGREDLVPQGWRGRTPLHIDGLPDPDPNEDPPSLAEIQRKIDTTVNGLLVEYLPGYTVDRDVRTRSAVMFPAYYNLVSAGQRVNVGAWGGDRRYVRQDNLGRLFREASVRVTDAGAAEKLAAVAAVITWGPSCLTEWSYNAQQVGAHWVVMSTDSESDAWNPRRCIVYVIVTLGKGLFQEIRKLPAGWEPTD